MGVKEDVGAVLDGHLAADAAAQAAADQQQAELRDEINRLQTIIDSMQPEAPATRVGAWLQNGDNPFGALGAERLYDSGYESAYGSSKLALLKQGVPLAVYSHKPGLAATSDSLEAFYRTIPQGLTAALIVQHEPENNGYSAAQETSWKNLQYRHADVVRKLNGLGWQLEPWVCLMGWPVDPDNPNTAAQMAKWFVPGVNVAWDQYPHSDVQGNGLQAAADFCAEHGVKWGVAEIGWDTETFGIGASGDQAALARIEHDFRIMLDPDNPAQFVCVFHGDGTWGKGPRHYRFDTTGRPACLARCRELFAGRP